MAEAKYRLTPSPQYREVTRQLVEDAHIFDTESKLPADPERRRQFLDATLGGILYIEDHEMDPSHPRIADIIGRDQLMALMNYLNSPETPTQTRIKLAKETAPQAARIPGICGLASRELNSAVVIEEPSLSQRARSLVGPTGTGRTSDMEDLISLAQARHPEPAIIRAVPPTPTGR